MKPAIKSVAERFIAEHFPEAELVFIGGSHVWGKPTHESDIDLVIIDENQHSSGLSCHKFEGWKIEAFRYHPSSLPIHFEAAKYKGIATLIKICADGYLLLGDSEKGEELRREAANIYEHGPSPWGEKQVDQARYLITDLLSDFQASEDPQEDIYIVNEILNEMTQLILRANKEWIGWGKWNGRRLWESFPHISESLTQSYRQYFQKDDKAPFIAAVKDQLAMFGGEIFAGYKEDYL
ncbi:nucleotidyltransferase domain-containing protein [Thalassobacillus pellis]|uniref:nucleotidyltransferase domain-containing protein n=1 Tax=Thalassobacillus pellis TaxID=748008 RepID=UPI00196126EF|nr:nucleotidyltransferase domain-containing protein [Thalassobacillus pellis]MBM7551996.1 putative nucleotidyltransferase [Thalassobacillus pellis]